MSNKKPVQNQIIKNSEGNEFEAEEEVNSCTQGQVTTRIKAHLYPMVQQLIDLTKLNPNLTQKPYLWNWFNESSKAQFASTWKSCFVGEWMFPSLFNSFCSESLNFDKFSSKRWIGWKK